MAEETKRARSIVLKGVRIAFADGLYQAKAFEGKGTPRYNCTFLIEPGSENDKVVKAALEAAANEKWGKKAAEIYKSVEGRPQSCCYYSGNLKEYDGFENMMALSAVRQEDNGPPSVVNRDKSPLTRQSGLPYSGSIVNAKVQIWAQDNSFGKGLRCTLEAVQFSKDAPAFGGGAPANADGFDEEEVESDLLN